jgi:hypothetical protein
LRTLVSGRCLTSSRLTTTSTCTTIALEARMRFHPVPAGQPR